MLNIMCELKNINIKYCICYYFDDMINIKDINLCKTLIDGKWFNSSLVYHVKYETPVSVYLYGVKPFCIISIK